jgi:hypothetical protein
MLFLSCILLLFSSTLAVRLLHETKTSVTVELPYSVSRTEQAFTFKRLSVFPRLSIQAVFMEYANGIENQTAIFRVAREIITEHDFGLISRVEYEEWDATLSLDVRESVSKAAVELNLMKLSRGNSRLTNVQIFALLDKICGSRGLIEFASYLKSLNEEELKKVAMEALKVAQPPTTTKQEAEAQAGRKSKNGRASRKAPAKKRKNAPTPRKAPARKKAKIEESPKTNLLWPEQDPHEYDGVEVFEV